MELFLINNDYKYAVEQIMFMLFPEESAIYPQKASGGLKAEVKLSEGEKFVTVTTVISNASGESFRGRAAVSQALF